MDYVKIPQNVRIEDKLIGPLSLKQIVMIAVGGGISYTFYAGIQKSAGTVAPALHTVIWIPAILAVAFAMVRISDISLFRYSLLILETLIKPSKRIWQPRQGIVTFTVSKAALEKDQKKKKEVVEIPKEPAVRLQDLSSLLDRGVDVKEKQDAPDEDMILSQGDSDAHGKRIDALWKEMKTTS